jgi:DNA mismatch repair protein MutL
VGKVRKLDEALVRLIAAGEVVERPASVLKELVENALDAGASRVRVEIEGAGKRSILVADDGEGMDETDARLALERHATSKLRDARDLESVATLGFRGEALPSIAAVSRLEILTSQSASGGVRVTAGGGEPSVAPAARARGTSVAVRDLFHATPARRKFLKSDAAELRRLLDVVVEAALARLDVAFEVLSGGRPVLELGPAPRLEARVAELWGPAYAADLLPFERTGDGWAARGLLQRPAAAGRGRRLLLFLNGRAITDRALGQAVLRGYASTLAPGAFPHALVFLTVPAGEVDVNVHPAKREVRFREPDRIFGFLHAAVREGLGGLRSAAGLDPGRGPRRLRRVPAGANGGARVTPAAAAPPPGPAAPGASERAATDAAGGARERARGYAPSADQLGLFLNARPRAREGGATAAAAAPAPRLWQLHDTYILVQTGEGLAVVDQHAAHERVLFEAIVAAFDREAAPSQELVFPRTFQLDAAEWSAWEENRGMLERLGYRVEPFGVRTVALRAVPALGHGFRGEESFLEMLADLTRDEPGGPEPNRHRRLARSLACRAAVKAGQPLAADEMDRLLGDLFSTPLPTADVHGRPAIVRIGLDDLARRFERA